MESDYKKLSQYIREVSNKNSDLQVKRLLGVSVNKVFIPSIANIVGTDLRNYKIVLKNQFAYGPVTSRNSDKISIALLDEDECIISTSYTVFEIIDTNELLPEYLMMWFRREEFDRYARYMSHGSVREIFGWEEMCDVEIPVPDIEIQKEIVKEYNTIINRIELNNQLIQKLEETAQTIYKQWFVDFEFPDENGNPYKSSGGEMEYNEELNMEIPIGWEYVPVSDISKDIVCGKTPPTSNKKNYGNYMPFVTIPDMHNKIFTNKTQRLLSEKGVNTQKNKTLPVNSICVSCIATAGLTILTSEECQTNQQINSIICNNNISPYYIYFVFKNMGEQIKDWGLKGTVGANLNKTEFSQIKIIKPKDYIMLSFDKLIEPVFKTIKNYELELNLLVDFRQILLSKMSKIPVEVVAK